MTGELIQRRTPPVPTTGQSSTMHDARLLHDAHIWCARSIQSGVDQLRGYPAGAPTPRPLAETYPVVVSGRYLTAQEVVVIGALYWPYLELEHLVAICQRESGLWTAAWNLNPGVEDSRGLLQINVDAWTSYRLWNLWDPQINLYFGAIIYHAEGWRPWYMANPPYLPWL